MPDNENESKIKKDINTISTKKNTKKKKKKKRHIFRKIIKFFFTMFLLGILVCLGLFIGLVFSIQNGAGANININGLETGMAGGSRNSPSAYEVQMKECEEESYVGVEDEEILNKVFAIFKEKYKDEFNFVDED